MSKTLGTAIDEVINALQDLDESSRPIAIKAACEHLKIQMYQFVTKEERVTARNETEYKETQANDSSKNEKIIDIRSLKETKNPANAQEMACIVALYLSEKISDEDKKDEIETNDIEKYFKQANFPLPKVPSQVLRNAKGAGYFDSSSKGKFKLNPVGYNLAVHSLPRNKDK